MPDNECIPYYEPGGRVTGEAGAGGIIGKRFVKVGTQKWSNATINGLDNDSEGSNLVVVTSGVGDRAIGVASYDTALGKVVTIIMDPGMVVPITALDAIVPGEEVESAAGGKATAVGAGPALGIALCAAAADQDCMVKLY